MKLTKVEKIILENTNEKFKYIARDKIGQLFLYVGKPVKKRPYGTWRALLYCSMGAFSHLFQDIKWEDKEPYKFR